MDHEEPEQVVQDDPQEVHKVEAIIANIKASISQNQLANAMKVAASCFPAPIKNPALKQTIADVWAQLFLHLPATEAFVKELDHEQCANIMKYSYLIMKQSGDKKTCDHCLGYHTHIIKKEGVGVINRVFVERKV